MHFSGLLVLAKQFDLFDQKVRSRLGNAVTTTVDRSAVNFVREERNLKARIYQ